MACLENPPCRCCSHCESSNPRPAHSSREQASPNAESATVPSSQEMTRQPPVFNHRQHAHQYHDIWGSSNFGHHAAHQPQSALISTISTILFPEDHGSAPIPMLPAAVQDTPSHSALHPQPALPPVFMAPYYAGIAAPTNPPNLAMSPPPSGPSQSDDWELDVQTFSNESVGGYGDTHPPSDNAGFATPSAPATFNTGSVWLRCQVCQIHVPATPSRGDGFLRLACGHTPGSQQRILRRVHGSSARVHRPRRRVTSRVASRDGLETGMAAAAPASRL